MVSLNRWKLCPFIVRASLIFQLAISSCSNINHMRSAAGSFRSLLWRLWKASHYYLKYLQWLSLSTTDLVFPRNIINMRELSEARSAYLRPYFWAAGSPEHTYPLMGWVMAFQGEPCGKAHVAHTAVPQACSPRQQGSLPSISITRSVSVTTFAEEKIAPQHIWWWGTALNGCFQTSKMNVPEIVFQCLSCSLKILVLNIGHIIWLLWLKILYFVVIIGEAQ